MSGKLLPFPTAHNKAEEVAYAYRVATRRRSRQLRELARDEAAMAILAIQACRLASPGDKLAPFLIAITHRRWAREYRLLARGLPTRLQ